MSIGLGIFLSTVLALIAWQVDKRDAWRTTLKAAGWALLATILIGLGILAWTSWKNGADSRTLAKRINSVREGRTNEYWGVEIGMPPEQVLYLKGEPRARLAREGDIPAQWHYPEIDSPSDYVYVVLFDEAGLVSAIACYTRNEYSHTTCMRIAGVGIGTSEQELVNILGTPDIATRPDTAGMKTIEYGGAGTRVRFQLRQTRVGQLMIDARVAAKPLGKN